VSDNNEVPVVRGLINGEWVVGGGEVKDTINPSTGAVASRVPYSTPAQVDAAVAAAKDAQASWAATALALRADVVAAAIDVIEQRGHELLPWMSREMGKTIAEGEHEVFQFVVGVTRAMIAEARTFGGRTMPPADGGVYPGRRSMTIHQPIGVTAYISPWNFPVEMLGNAAIALVMGNACVWKPSEWAPYAPQLITEMFVSAGLPDGLINLVYGGPDIGEQLVTHDDVGMLAFIGSTAVGERIHEVAGVKRLLLELGGNGPLVVMADADLEKAAEAAAVGSFYQAGQVCTSAERILVHEDVYDEFAALMVEKARAVRLGDPLDPQTTMGPLSERRILAKVRRLVDEAVEAGAKILFGGGNDGLFFEPTVLTEVTPKMSVAQEETLGPVAPLIRFGSREEALEIANATPWGLVMAAFTRSLRDAFVLAEGFEAGAVNINAGTNDWELNGPFGGWKKSGLGRELAADCLREFTNVKTVTIDIG
jgi:acyl-CoA reductase-like NAD-dependent aldehyde dehydrogenase